MVLMQCTLNNNMIQCSLCVRTSSLIQSRTRMRKRMFNSLARTITKQTEWYSLENWTLPQAVTLSLKFIRSSLTPKDPLDNTKNRGSMNIRGRENRGNILRLYTHCYKTVELMSWTIHLLSWPRASWTSTKSCQECKTNLVLWKPQHCSPWSTPPTWDGPVPLWTTTDGDGFSSIYSRLIRQCASSAGRGQIWE